MAAKVTKRQQAVLDCIEDCIREKGYGPTVREVCHALGLSSPSTVHVHLKALEEKGLIKRDPLKSRSISLTYPLEGSSVQASSVPDVVQPSFSKIVNVPLVGDVAAGVPILAEENFPSDRHCRRCPLVSLVRARRINDRGRHQQRRLCSR